MLKNARHNKSMWPRRYPGSYIKGAALCSLFNKSLMTSSILDEWKKSNVTPVHKKDSLEAASNYRPISLLSIVSKVMERCL